MKFSADPRSALPLLLSIAALALTLAGCTGGAGVEVPILVQELPPKPADAPVDVYWGPKSLEDWLQLAANPEKAPDLTAAGLTDTHTLWENRSIEQPTSKVADMVASAQISLKHPREWLLLELGEKARQLGADGVVVTSIQVRGLTGHQNRNDYDEMWTASTIMKVWLYAQAVHYD